MATTVRALHTYKAVMLQTHDFEEKQRRHEHQVYILSADLDHTKDVIKRLEEENKKIHA